MTEINAENYNEHIRSGERMLLMLFDPDDPMSIVALPVLERVDQMQGKDFVIAKANAITEKEIVSALGPVEIPSIIFFEDKKIKKRLAGIPTENQIIDLTK